MIKCTSFWGHNYETKKEIENDHEVTFKQCEKCGHRKNYRYSGEESIEYEIYTITAPFGVLYTNKHGLIDGHYSGFIFHSGYINGSISTELDETYIVKYMDKNELKTKKFDALNTSLIVDGKFCLEKKYNVRYKKEAEEKWVVNYKLDSDWSSTWIIHIPKLPELDQKMTTKYMGD